jgi:hypothetical protein
MPHPHAGDSDATGTPRGHEQPAPARRHGPPLRKYAAGVGGHPARARAGYTPAATGSSSSSKQSAASSTGMNSDRGARMGLPRPGRDTTKMTVRDSWTGRKAWRVATRPGKPTLEVLPQEDWNTYSTETQAGFQSVRAFPTEQEADLFARGRVDAAKLEAAKPGR